MFDQKQSAAFRSITAPDELREKILAMEQGTKRKPHIIISICTAAACLLLIAAIPLLNRTLQRNPVFYVNGTTIESDAVLLTESGEAAPIMARAVPKYTAEISAEFPKKTVLTVSEGNMELINPDSTGVISSGTECTVDGEVLIRWSVDIPVNDAEYYLTADTKGEIQKFVLYYDFGKSAWYIMQENNQ